MELNLQRQTIPINEGIYDGTLEQSIACDALLPDYCPDISKILKCTLTPTVHTVNTSGGTLALEGTAAAHIYYCAAGGGLRHAEYSIPFARTVDLPAAPAVPVSSVAAGVDSVSCRAVNQRRIDIRGVLRLSVRVVDARPEEFLCDADGGGLQLRREMRKAARPEGQYDLIFPISEELELGHGKPPINTIFRADARVHVQDWKPVGGRVVMEGTLLLHVCYQPLEEESRLETMEYALPFSQVLDAAGADEDCICRCAVRMAACSVNACQNPDGAYVHLALEASLHAAVSIYRPQEIPVVSDCYSTRYACSAKTRPICFCPVESAVRESVLHTAALDLPQEIESVIDVWCTVGAVQSKPEDSAFLAGIQLNVTLFARLPDGEPACFDQSILAETRLPLPEGGDPLRLDASATLLSCSHRLLGREQLEVRCEVALQGCLFRETRCSALTEIALDESAPRETPKNKLYLYYAEAGESLWDIAKAHNTSTDAIWEENSVEADRLTERTMLLIPIV